MTTSIPTPPKLIEGWFRHQDSQGKRSHACRTLPGNDTHYVTLCGQVWLRSSIVDGTPPSASSLYKGRWFCQHCVKAEPLWRAN